DAGAVWITLNRPAALNALDTPTKEALVAALEQAAADPSVRAVALTGAGRAFCVGEDLRGLEAGYAEGRAPELGDTLQRHYAPAVRLLAEMPKPTVAVVNGVAAGAGASLAFACDLRVASAAASFRLAFGGVGLVPDAGATYHLPRLVGLAKAMELAMLGGTVRADEARSIGLVSRVFPAEELAVEAAALVAALAAGPTLALARTKALLRDGLHADLAWALDAEAGAQVACGQTSDHLEGVAAFLEKRAPRFQGA
ncbi:MAG TPA: enoyl-CoA hydratase-related protein, partial [Actinomycetota bacterium]|nr:enoyl-CoA hydratase-related protein [Actinomycetota bacterium]